MQEVSFNVHRGNRLISRMIMAFSHGKFSHASVCLGDTAYEAVEGHGMVSTGLSEWNPSPIVETYAFSVPDWKYAEIEMWLRSQVGKKYDWTGVFAHVFPLFLEPRYGYWYCSELTFVVLNKAFGILDEDIAGQKISPQLFRDILLLASQINVKIK